MPKIEFIPDGSDDCPILQISGTDFQTSRELFHAVRSMRDSMAGSFMICDVQGFEGCRSPELEFEIAETNIGVQWLPNKGRFRCALSYEGWTSFEDLLAPFCQRDSSSTGFQWLDESGEIALLFSPNGGW